ncbi:MAG: DUF5320 domain-containing protein [Candidatus Krumholzibacteria bacterium]|nr:DUF5320 domain-containing protein [Candidatus Krumholzibacteria bacterium]
MPGGDGTGPSGMGPMTGRAAGYCAGNPMPGSINPVYGRGLGYGRGFGRGLGRGFRGGRSWGGYWGDPYGGYTYPYGSAYGAQTVPYALPYGYAARPSPEQETDILKGQAEYLENTLEGIKKRISELEAGEKK